MRIVLAALLLAAGIARAQMPDLDKVQIKTVKVAGSLSMLEGAGGNIGVSAGDDGVFVIDDQFAPLAPKILAAIAAISKKPLKLVINTHWHSDHTGGNEPMTGAGALIVAHDNVRKRMSVEQVMEAIGRRVPASPPKALPVVTFADAVTLHLNGDEVRVFHVQNAHTDGDAIVHFTKADAIHMGDCFINGKYPVIDYGSGGTIDGYIAAQKKVLALAGDATKIIPGHGPLGDKAALQTAHEVIVKVREAVAKAAAGGKKLEEVIAAKPTAPWDAEWGAGFVKPEMLVTMIYKTLPPPAAKKKK